MAKKTTEDKAIEDAQDALGALKKALRTIQTINTDAGRHSAANSAMGFLGDVITLHSRMTVDLNVFYPELSGEIVTRGGGAR